MITAVSTRHEPASGLPAENRVRLVVDGMELMVWPGVRINTSIEQAVWTFALTATERYPRDFAPVPVRVFAPCTLYIGKDKVLTGYVESVTVQDTGIAITGASKTSDIVDCSAMIPTMAAGAVTKTALGSLKGVTLEQAAATLLEPYGIAVKVDVATGRRYRHTITPGESVFESIERVARQRALLLTTNADGDLVITRAGTSLADTALERPGNVISGSVSFNGSERFSLYECRGQRVGSDTDTGAALSSLGTAEDDIFEGRFRYYLITERVGGGISAYKDRATWEAAQRAGRSVTAQYTVRGWRQRSGDLWAPNLRVPVLDYRAGLGTDGAPVELLITGCSYQLDDRVGTRCELTLQPPEGFELLEPRKKSRSGKRKVTASGPMAFTTEMVKAAEIRAAAVAKALKRLVQK